MSQFIKAFVFPFLLLAALACEDDNDSILQEGDPYNLEVEVTIEPEGSGQVIVQASAENAVAYDLRLEEEEEPMYTNTSGTFEHTFLQPGDYALEVRAYGSNERYLRKVVGVTITFEEEDVPVDQGYVTPMEYEGYDLVWHDEVDGNDIDPDNWVFEIGDGCPDLCGWGNNESQYYLEENAWVDDGVLTIEAREESAGTRDYTSARMKTQGKHSFQYGRIDIRALLPRGQGIWPALWMLGNDIETVGWPKCGEIDIMEMIGGSGRENEVHGTLHWDNNGHTYSGGSHTLPSGTFGDEYHVFTIIWDETSIRWFVNDIEFYELLITPAHMAEFHQEFFFIFNVAVGGNWPGYPDETTVFPQQMRVDYVRVFQESK